MSEPTPQEIAEASPKPRARKKPAEIHREFPQAPDAEKAVLASILLAPEEALDICDEKGLSPDAFYLPAHAEIYRSLRFIRDAKRPVDFITVAERLRDINQLDNIGGPAYLNELYTLLPSAANVGFHIELLLSKRTLRHIIRTCNEFSNRSYDEQDRPEILLGEAEAAILAIRKPKRNEDFRPIKGAVYQALDNIQRSSADGGGIRGISWGLRTVDLATDGIVQGEFTILAGLPGSGKTSLLRQSLAYIAENVGPVAVWNLEMGDDQLAEAWIFHLAEVNPVELRHRGMFDHERERIMQAAERLAKMNITLTGAPGMTIQAFQASLRRAVKELKIVTAAVDSATQVRAVAGNRRWEDVNEISSGFKAAGKENNVGLVALWHVGSEFEKRLATDPLAVPKGFELEGGAGGSRNADKFLTLVSRDYIAEDGTRVKYHELCSSKQRMGEREVRVPLTFEARYTRFTEPQSEPEQTDFAL